ncbi:hypothetical protein FRACYDRAFT_235740 [Fragilariopsis cylindrus CCMP1102]|uniref:Uncharacterized protein n=1 Tax=Fragilariopsis cylindrus CCMP1102 TaxID=635003 RepID=A0A1E7FNK9_9STRA|nr:hypothetical protein FRACYDRAFT_235740 [Fragilariopsis cylindrus CCMP1102]|eukprot:OEU19685.1 hypothetical protein FRACYDRAFT_235740 [Fragilariopsis cylindrus CCMP1102]
MMIMKSIIGHRSSVPSLFAVASKKRPIISARRCFLSITNVTREMIIDEISKDEDMRNDATYSLSFASDDDSGFSPLSRDLNTREREQLSISKNQLLLHVVLRQQDDPVPVISFSRKQEDSSNRYSNYYLYDSTIFSSIAPSLSKLSAPTTQFNIFTATTHHNSNQYQNNTIA